MAYVKAFEDAEFERRRSEVEHRMEDAGFELLVCQDPANMNWLTGFDGWSFYTPQAVLVHRDEEVSDLVRARPGCPVGDHHDPAFPPATSSRSRSRWSTIGRAIRSTSCAS